MVVVRMENGRHDLVIVGRFGRRWSRITRIAAPAQRFEAVSRDAAGIAWKETIDSGTQTLASESGRSGGTLHRSWRGNCWRRYTESRRCASPSGAAAVMQTYPVMQPWSGHGSSSPCVEISERASSEHAARPTSNDHDARSDVHAQRSAGAHKIAVHGKVRRVRTGDLRCVLHCHFAAVAGVSSDLPRELAREWRSLHASGGHCTREAVHARA